MEPRGIRLTEIEAMSLDKELQSGRDATLCPSLPQTLPQVAVGDHLVVVEPCTTVDGRQYPQRGALSSSTVGPMSIPDVNPLLLEVCGIDGGAFTVRRALSVNDDAIP
jgi:hypothetical protein